MPHVQNNIPQNIFYSAINGEFEELLVQLYASGALYLRLKSYLNAWNNKVPNVVPQALL